ncbi:phosphatidylserine decarboxylase [Pseudomonas syringae]|uniref:Phosphatidylserine decarboxylase proenzyme n=3 Tax=Pseudomonas syringae TaxID=317 RepID=A0A9Q4A534_PSESX|nr:phosphatidylserine decarboxylase [Pseudomonas syringae]MCF5472756.1 phosphatidylserine decarboxylase [Pseudomonas syringae]MCF5481388.1 phosphatidylserine decarboxylase [Pseudomonas syringae]MCF5486799.1 phosphatidylserine decarboxylase [Pseudomonas syringae]MCF5492703.1 phosphatidylserine decarboxylase [Pseudomonas syringae]
MSEFTGLSLVIEPNDLLQRLDAPELILVDLTSSARYEAGHIRGARFVDPKRTQLGTPPAPGLLPEHAGLEQLFGELGHNPDAVYVVYDDEGGGWAGRFIWLLDVIGHTRYHYLDGGVLAWEAESLPLSTEVPPVAGGPVTLTLHDEPTATREYLQSRLGAADLAIWDARGPTEYSGEKVVAAKGGHIPGAVNFEWTEGMDKARNLRIRQDMPEILRDLGITPDKEVITHCQTHHRSGFTYLVAKALGYPRVKAYAGSWGEWGNHPETPVEGPAAVSAPVEPVEPARPVPPVEAADPVRATEPGRTSQKSSGTSSGPSMKDRLFILSQYLLPHHLLSRLAGCVAECRVRWFKNAFTAWFARRYQVDMSQALVEDLTSYEHFNAFFTRALKPDARPLDTTPGAILSPADGAVSQLGPIEHGRIFQAKGHSFSVLELLGGDPKLSAPFMGGEFATVYLSPKDYHRVHMPLAGTLREMVYVPGRIFSVNQTTAENVPELFARNERVVCLFDTERGPMAVVLVGAMIVASVETVWAGLVTPPKRELKTFRYDEAARAPIHLEKGAEMGRFKLGSTAIVLFGPNQVQWVEQLKAGSSVQMGQALAVPKHA